MTSSLSTNPTALPIQLWAVLNICLTLLPRAGCCDTSTAKGIFGSSITSRSVWVSTQRTFKISHVHGKSLLCSFEQRLPERPQALSCLLAVLLENTMYFGWRIMLWPSLIQPKHRGRRAERAFPWCACLLKSSSALQLLVKFITLQVTATISSRGGNVRLLLRLLGSRPWF